MRIEDYENNYRLSLDATQQFLEKAFVDISVGGELPLDSNQITRAILLRMRTFYLAQTKMKDRLKKRYVAPASDYFVEAIVFYLMLLNETFNLNIEVKSEFQIKKGLRPDISIWRNEKLFAIIECKTQLGWSRSNWEQDFLDREVKIRSSFSNVRMFLLVLTEKNWSGFGDHHRLEKEYFVLSKIWPTEIIPENLDEIIKTRIEVLFQQIKNLAVNQI
ncbi:MAG: hypothetical protein LCI00_10745 [Chloroflexi bacterium]|nr:hypothetical protein [Chloroflexota bacterium]MCC6892083.1 hypothetical protein [Anaerolineae bacterium]